MFKRVLPIRFAHVLLVMVTLAVLHTSARAEDLRDPTRPSYLKGSAGVPDGAGASRIAPNLVLNAIRLSPTRRSAMINDRSVRVGEQIGDVRVAAIDHYSVRLQRGTELITLKLLPITVKQAPRAARR